MSIHDLVEQAKTELKPECLNAITHLLICPHCSGVFTKLGEEASKRGIKIKVEGEPTVNRRK